MTIKNIVFDFGGVLIDWNPIYLYKSVFADKLEMDYFLKDICSPEWNLKQDEGRSLAEATKELQLLHPEYTKEIELFYKDWIKMIGGDLPENSKFIKSLKSKYRLFGLSNWSAETFPQIFDSYTFFQDLEGIVLSGQEKTIKPNKGLYEILLNRYSLLANECLFIDDNRNNIIAAKELGFHTIHLTEGVCLEKELIHLGIL